MLSVVVMAGASRGGVRVMVSGVEGCRSATRRSGVRSRATGGAGASRTGWASGSALPPTPEEAGGVSRLAGGGGETGGLSGNRAPVVASATGCGIGSGADASVSTSAGRRGSNTAHPIPRMTISPAAATSAARRVRRWRSFASSAARRVRAAASSSSNDGVSGLSPRASSSAARASASKPAPSAASARTRQRSARRCRIRISKLCHCWVAVCVLIWLAGPGTPGLSMPLSTAKAVLYFDQECLITCGEPLNSRSESLCSRTQSA